MGAVRGKDFKLYVDTDEPYDGTPTWAEVTNCRDVTENLEKALADASTRLTTFRQQLGTLKELSLDFQMVYDADDPNFVLFEDAFYNDTNLFLAVLDGSIHVNGSKGIVFMAQVSKFTENQALEDVGLVDVTVVVGYDAVNLPHRVVATGSVLAPPA